MSLMRFDFLTLFPEMCATVMNESIIGRAAAAGIIESHFFNIRDYTENRQKQVDDAPFGGGMGMVMQAQPIYDCFVAARDEDERKPYVIYMSPQGKVFNQQKAVELSKKDRIVFLCGHYEGVDERVIQAIADEEVSAGDYVLTGGELPAMIVADAVSRMIPGVLADEECYTDESIYSGLLEYPQYSRPRVWRGMEVPEVLLSGHHENIRRWRHEQKLIRTLKKRPDLLKKAALDKKDRDFLASVKNRVE